MFVIKSDNKYLAESNNYVPNFELAMKFDSLPCLLEYIQINKFYGTRLCIAEYKMRHDDFVIKSVGSSFVLKDNKLVTSNGTVLYNYDTKEVLI